MTRTAALALLSCVALALSPNVGAQETVGRDSRGIDGGIVVVEPPALPSMDTPPVFMDTPVLGDTMTPEELVASTPPPVFYDTGEPGTALVEPPPPRPLRNLSADTDQGSKIVVVKTDAPGQSPEARFSAAQRAMALGRWGSALQIYDGLLEKTPKDPHVLMGRAVALHRLGRFDEAIGAYEQLLDVRPETVEAEVNMLGLMAERYPAVALQRLRKLHQKHPQRTDILAQMAVAQGELGNFDGALQALGMTAATEPTNPLHLYNMAVVADRSGRSSEAVSYYEKALEVDSVYGREGTLPRSEIYARLAQIR